MGVFFALLFYFAAVVMVTGVLLKIRQYASTPAPLKIPTTPAPTTKMGVVLRMTREVVLFESLFKANKWIWIFGWLFHFSLLLVLLRHFRYFIEPIWAWVLIVQPFGKYAAYGLLLGLTGLLVRRIVVDRVRYISAPSDFLMLALLLSIGISGFLMSFVWHTDIVQVKAYFLGLIYFNWQAFPTESLNEAGSVLLVVHLFLVALLMLVFSFSKLLHAPGLFFSPTRNQVDNPRERRFISDWAARLDSQKSKSS